MTRLLAAALCLAMAGPALAAENTQQARMRACNEQATGQTGPERKRFMSRCLKGEAAAPGATPQQQRMKDCNAQAAGKKGAERKAFMSECLRK